MIPISAKCHGSEFCQSMSAVQLERSDGPKTQNEGAPLIGEGTASGVRFFSFLAIEFFDKVLGIPKFTIGCKL